MQDDHTFLEAVMDLVGAKDAAFELVLNEDVHEGLPLSGVTIGPPPKQNYDLRTSRRSSDYFVKKPLCRMTCIVDESVLSSLTSKMLGPQTDFSTVQIMERIDSGAGGRSTGILMRANIVNSVQMPGGILRLGLVVIEVLDTNTGKSLSPSDVRGMTARL